MSRKGFDMSFIFENDNLINQLLQSGAEFELKFTKRGQAATALSQAQKVLGDVVDSLEREVAGKSGAGEFYPTSNVDINSENMDSMGDFLEWADAHGKRDVAVKVNPDRSNRPGNNYAFVKVEPGTKIATPLERPDNSPIAYWVNFDGLKKYLQALQGDESLKDNTIFQVQLLKLIQFANQKFDMDLGETYQKTYNDDFKLDDVPPVLKDRDSSPGSVPLTYGDLKSQDTFNTWLSKPVAVGRPDFNLRDNADQFLQGNGHCLALNYLNYRAIAHMRSRPGYAEIGKVYIGLLQQLAKAFGCTLGGQLGQQQPGQGQGQPGQASPADVQRVVESLPLDLHEIDFSKIRSFFQQVAPLLANNPSVASTIQAAEQNMQAATNASKTQRNQGGETLFQLGGGLQAFSAYSDSASQHAQLIRLLYSILQSTRQVIAYFLSQYGRMMQQENQEDALTEIYNQIGKREDDDSIYSRNLQQLRQLSPASSGTLTNPFR